MVEAANNQAKLHGKPLRIMFQDEARFGRINDPRRCWAPPKCRPVVNAQCVREYTYLYGALSPADGACDFLLLPSMTQACIDIFLMELSCRYPDEYILLICDGAACHQMYSASLPKNIMLETLPPYCPDLNPVENVWDELRETFFTIKSLTLWRLWKASWLMLPYFMRVIQILLNQSLHGRGLCLHIDRKLV